ncbi:MAG TPA: MBL fold metallo-hydrolase [Blastocatellia bacterium]|nr:MBL fold metallo-hydrolase [Blastocatellia bacterium]
MIRITPLALVLIVLIVCGSARAHDPALQDKGPFTLKKLADDTYVLYGRGGNIGFLVTDEGVVLVDDQFADLAPGIAEQIKSVTTRPVRFLINTHHHGDHTGGNAFFIKMTTIVAHDNVRKHMLAGPQETMANAPRNIENLEKRIASLEKDDPQSKDLAGLKQQVENAKRSLETARSIKIADIPAPNITFDRELRMYLGGREIQVFHLKRGHTDGDSIICFPHSKVVHMGDLFFNKVIPVIDRAHGASTLEWTETIDAVIARVDPASQFIPGHGEVTTAADLKAFKQYLLDLRTAVKKAIDQGMTREQAIKEVKLAQYSQYGGYEQRFPGNVGTVYDELKASK